jgi:hypothetical protein
MPPLELIDICWLNSVWLVIVSPAIILYTVNGVLRSIKPAHRACSPDAIWWCLIPVVGHFILYSVTLKVSKSLHRQFHETGHHLMIDQYGANMGKYWALLGIFFNLYVVGFVLIYEKFRFFDLLRFENAMILIPVVLARGTCSFMYWREMLRCRSRLMFLLKPEMSDDEMNYQDEPGGDS